MKYEDEIRDVEPIRVAYTRDRGIVSETNKVFSEVLRTVCQLPRFLLEMKLKVKGLLHQSYTAIGDYAAEIGILLHPSFRETFIKGAGRILRGNPDRYITEMWFPIKEDKYGSNFC